MTNDATEDLFAEDLPPRPKKSRPKSSPPKTYKSYATVAVNQPVMGTFDYGIPESMLAQIEEGALVEVPFGGRLVRGCVINISEQPPKDVPARKIKALKRRITPEFHITPALIELSEWISAYYLAPLGETLASVSFIGFHDLAEKSTRLVSLADNWETIAAERKTATGRAAPITAAQRRVVDVLQQPETSLLQPGAVCSKAGVGASVVRKMIDDGLLTESYRTETRHDDYGAAARRDEPIALNPAQQAGFDSIAWAMDTRVAQTYLIHGVTGSGKTEVYLQAIAKALAEGGSAIVLVPEISLTPQTVERFRSRFCDTVGVYHSRLTAGQKFDLWRQVESGSCRIMVGARSALFTPFPNLALVVIDEEHETSYKQDSSPRYNARDMAVVRSNIEGHVVLLGSATPSIESYFNAKKGTYELIELPDRVDDLPLPPVRVIDMTREVREGRTPGLLSDDLHTAMTQALARNEQVLLFLNRRGFFNFVVCLACNTAIKCDHCDVTLTHHKPRQMLQCHYCGRDYPIPRKCPACESPELSMVGLGTQRMEETVQQEFPKANVIRMDLDTTRQRNAYIDAWRRIERGDVDVILGTQMIAKGIHLERVTLVGVPLADVSLFQPDFRSAERAFSVLTQVAGRAGRGDKPGQVIIQTYVPHHYAIQFAQNHDYLGFFEKELRVREVLRFPPHYRLISVLGSGTDAPRTAELFKEFARRARNASYAMGDAVMVLGPAPAPIHRIDDEYRWRLLLRGKDHRQLKQVIIKAIKRFEEVPGRTALRLTVDVDPQDLM
ncbi:primosomal protein N' [candidate division BRC1 bacterium HGW-BRC1-1]|jgi:primosomal protein N' (replication factor Y)|nr:MAG: primosomal protein N' [candidate division BRC1 bacterium HGW-BRC1-1]